MIKTEDRELDRALNLCKLIHNDLLSCVGVVQRLNRKYNGSDATRTQHVNNSTKVGGGTTTAATSSATSSSSTSSTSSSSSSSSSRSLGMLSNLSQSTLSLASTGASKAGARTSHELYCIFNDLKSRCLRLRRELEATTAQTQRLTEVSLRQESVQHRMLKNANSLETFECKHWGNNLGPKQSYTKSWRLKDFIEIPSVRKA